MRGLYQGVPPPVLSQLSRRSLTEPDAFEGSVARKLRIERRVSLNLTVSGSPSLYAIGRRGDSGGRPTRSGRAGHVQIDDARKGDDTADLADAWSEHFESLPPDRVPRAFKGQRNFAGSGGSRRRRRTWRSSHGSNGTTSCFSTSHLTLPPYRAAGRHYGAARHRRVCAIHAGLLRQDHRRHRCRDRCLPRRTNGKGRRGVRRDRRCVHRSAGAPRRLGDITPILAAKCSCTRLVWLPPPALLRHKRSRGHAPGRRHRIRAHHWHAGSAGLVIPWSAGPACSTCSGRASRRRSTPDTAAEHEHPRAASQAMTRAGTVRAGDRVRFDGQVGSGGRTGCRHRLTPAPKAQAVGGHPQHALRDRRSMASLAAAHAGPCLRRLLFNELPAEVQERARWWEEHLTEVIDGVPLGARWDAPPSGVRRHDHDVAATRAGKGQGAGRGASVA